MTQQLATATKVGSSWPLDFGTCTADAAGYLVVTRGAYRMSYAPDIKLADVVLSDVADNYHIPGSGEDPADVVAQWDALTFKLRFTQTERVNILTAAAASALVQDFVALLDTAAACGKMIYSNDPNVIAGVNAYASAGLINPGRPAVILGNGPSP